MCIRVCVRPVGDGGEFSRERAFISRMSRGPPPHPPSPGGRRGADVDLHPYVSQASSSLSRGPRGPAGPDGDSQTPPAPACAAALPLLLVRICRSGAKHEDDVVNRAGGAFWKTSAPAQPAHRWLSGPPCGPPPPLRRRRTPSSLHSFTLKPLNMRGKKHQHGRDEGACLRGKPVLSAGLRQQPTGRANICSPARL